MPASESTATGSTTAGGSTATDQPVADQPVADQPVADRMSRGRAWRLRLLVAVVAAVVVALDQVTKSLAITHLSTHAVHVFASIYLRLQLNSGAAFSLFQGFGLWISVVAIALVAVLVVATRWVRGRVGSVAIGLVLGGAVGNLADRLFRANQGAVIDFIYTRYWPTFNVADACIVVGAVLLILSSWHRPSVQQAAPGQHRPLGQQAAPDRQAAPGRQEPTR